MVCVGVAEKTGGCWCTQNKRVTKDSCVARLVHLNLLSTHSMFVFSCADASNRKLKSQGLEKHCDDGQPCVEPERVNTRRQY